MNIIRKKRENLISSYPYVRKHYKEYDYSILEIIIPKKNKAGSRKGTYNDVVIMGDTETSKKAGHASDVHDNHVVIWSISLRSYGHNICTLWGRRPSEFIDCVNKIVDKLQGDETYIYFHNLAYDWTFLRKFMIREWGEPEKQLNVKSHYPINIKFSNGVFLKDSLILAQRSLEKWAEDLHVEHQKAVGYWNYEKLRAQDTFISDQELTYVCFDTLCGVECIETLMNNLNKHIYAMPYTATGITRERVRKRGKGHRAHDRFLRQALDWKGLQKAEAVYHGGFTHANRHYLSQIIRGLIQCYDFASSYPFIMCAFMFPMEKFTELHDCSIEDIIKASDDYAFMFKLILTDVRLKDDDVVMPVLQLSKCVKSINAITDNGRILKADYIEIYITEIDLKLILRQYVYDKHICHDVSYAKKDYLPKWFTDYVYQCFIDKTKLKNGDPVLYAIAKTVINSLYGMSVQHAVRPEIIENYSTGEYEIDRGTDLEGMYNKFLKRFTSILPYQWGVYVTAYAMQNLFKLGKCCETWIYSDTDSCYGIGWDMEAVSSYNNMCKEMLMKRGYGAVIHDGREYWLGVAEHEDGKDDYTEFVTLGAKRYCGRCVKDGKLHITVAGVPKKGVKCLHDDIGNFKTGLIFDGNTTGKLTHTYFNIPEIYIDENGNETGDSINLSSCDYLLKAEDEIKWEDLLHESITIQVIEEQDIL